MTLTLPQRWLVSEGDTEKFYLDFTPVLATAETIATVTSVLEDTTDDLAAMTGTVTTVAYDDPHRRDAAGEPVTVAIGKAITWTVSGQKATTGRYALLVTVTTTTSRVLKRRLVFDVA